MSILGIVAQASFAGLFIFLIAILVAYWASRWVAATRRQKPGQARV